MSRKTQGVAAHARRIAALTTASSLALVAAQPAFAQQAGDSADEDAAEAPADENVILVTGFRQSLQVHQILFQLGQHHVIGLIRRRAGLWQQTMNGRTSSDQLLIRDRESKQQRVPKCRP